MNKKVIVIITLSYLLLLFTLTFPFKKYQITLPGNITDVNSSLLFEENINNQFYTTYVVSYRKPTLFQLFVSKIATSPKTSKNSLNNYYYDSFLDEELSFQYATISAYEKAKIVNEEIEIDYSLGGYAVVTTKNKSILGDVFTKIDNLDLQTTSYEDLLSYLANTNEITVTAEKDQQIKNYQLSKENNKFNLNLKPFYKINHLSPSYEKKYQNDYIGGPSGGLIQALFIYHQILKLETNLKIAGTCTITPTGNVGEIGGIFQKVFTVNQKVDLFFCPEAHFIDASLAYQKLSKPTFKLVFVSNLDEALEYLKNYE